MRTGTVKFFNEAKGFGMIIENGSNEEIFVHVTGLKDSISKGDEVTFEVQTGKKGLVAEDVKLA
jgi:cold shock protein